MPRVKEKKLQGVEQPEPHCSKQQPHESFCVLEWWKINEDLVIAEAAKIISCLPATQVSVERLFSALALILTEKRNRFKNEMIDAVLFLRVNGFDWRFYSTHTLNDFRRNFELNFTNHISNWVHAEVKN